MLQVTIRYVAFIFQCVLFLLASSVLIAMKVLRFYS